MKREPDVLCRFHLTLSTICFEICGILSRSFLLLPFCDITSQLYDQAWVSPAILEDQGDASAHIRRPERVVTSRWKLGIVPSSSDRALPRKTLECKP